MEASTQPAPEPARRPRPAAPDPDGPARLYALVIGAALALGGIGGFFYEASFETGGGLVSDEIFGLFPTSGWDNVLHLALGIAGLALASRAARAYALGLGLGFVLFAVWGMIETEEGIGAILDTFPVSGEDNALHLIVGLTGIGAAFVSLEQ